MRLDAEKSCNWRPATRHYSRNGDPEADPMDQRPLDVILRHLQRLAGFDEAGLTDGRLLQRFAAEGDEAAFETLLGRHSRLVWDVCRGILGHEQDAEDAFQATFLVLAHRAKSVRKQESVASWLYGVALRVAHRAKSEAGRRRAREKEAADMSQEHGAPDLAGQEAQSILREELQRVPARYREPLVLCHLEGNSCEEVASRLACPLGTVKSRLARGRELLRVRLTRRGVTLSAAALATALVGGTAEAAPAALVQATLRAAALIRRGGSLSAAASWRVAALTVWALNARAVSLLHVGAAALVLTAAAAVAGGLFQQVHQPEPTASREAVEPAAPVTKKQHKRAGHTDLYGDALPAGAVARLGTLRWRVNGWIEALTFSADSKVLGTAGTDQTVRLWDRRTGRELLRLQLAERDRPRAVAISPDGKRLAAASIPSPSTPQGFEVTLRIWDAATGREQVKVRFGKLRSAPDTVAWSPDGKTVALAGDALRLLDAATGRQRVLYEGNDTMVCGATFAPDGKTLAACYYDGAIRTWETATGKERSSFKIRAPSCQALAFMPDGRHIASAGSDGYVYISDVLRGTELRRIKVHREGLATVSLSADGKRMATGSWDATTCVWDLARDRELRRIQGPAGGITFAALSPDGKTVAIGAANGPNRVAVWDVDSGKAYGAGPGHSDPIRGVAISPDGKLVASSAMAMSGAKTVIRLWEARTGKLVRELRGHTGSVTAVAFSPDGKMLASTGWFYDNTLRLWEVATGRELRRIASPDASLTSVAFSPDGHLVAAGDAYYAPGTKLDARVRLWDRATGKLLAVMPGHQMYVTGVAFSPDGRSIFSAADAVRVWDTHTGKLRRVLSGLGERVLGFALSADARLVAYADARLVAYGRYEGILRIRETAKGKEKWRIKTEPWNIAALAFSPDGRSLASGDNDRTIRFWDVATGKVRPELRRKSTSAVRSLAYAPSGDLLASGGEDATVLVWDVAGVRQRGRKR
jgi:RNA polymerase sigma factor (sigma-70 family)